MDTILMPTTNRFAAIPRFREVYGYHSEEDIAARKEQKMETKSGSDIFAAKCPFTGFACTKSTATDEERDMTRPLGVCSATSPEGKAVVTCPQRFKATVVWDDLRQRLFPDTTGDFHVLEERKLGEAGRVDLVPLIHENGSIEDFAAVEIQASYFSGSSIRNEFNEYMDDVDEGKQPNPPQGTRQMDYRSCVDKRLLPQLQEKVETVEAWNKDFGVILQKSAFENSNLVRRIGRVPEEEATFFWFVYDYVEDTPGYRLELVEVFPTLFVEIDKAIGESLAPDLDEFMDGLQTKLQRELR